MARIRSIKPDFFTSETIAALPLSTRLTFIGLWTHVDDNGVTVDNARLITAAVWPLEEDPRETLQRTQEDLRRLSEAGLIVRYEREGRGYLYVSTWDEHQKVSHPGKARYPRPSTPTLTSANADAPEMLPKSSGESPEILRPEQGAGSREQGKNPSSSGEPMRADKGTRPPSPRKARPAPDDDPDFARFWAAYPRKADKGHARKAWAKTIKAGAEPEKLIAAAGSYADDPRRKADYTAYPATWLNGERWLDQPTTAAPVVGGAGGAWWEN